MGQVGEDLHVSHMTIWKVLHEPLLYPYQLRVQVLMPVDLRARENSDNVSFCEVLIISLFHQRSLQMRDGNMNIHNKHQWAEENLHSVNHSRHHQQFSMNTWAGTVRDYMVGPQVLPNRLTGNQYRDFLLDDLPKLIEDIPLAVIARMW
jgi:hypothetical protein